MTHYQKLAVMIFRIAGVIIIVSSLVLWVPAFFIMPQSLNPFFVLFTILPYLIIGIILFTLSRFLARWICLDFDRFNEQK